MVGPRRRDPAAGAPSLHDLRISNDVSCDPIYDQQCAFSAVSNYAGYDLPQRLTAG